MKLKMATFEPAVRSTIQGDGVYVGTPMTFVRLWGCDYSCSFCDTKETWREGSTWEEVEVADVVRQVHARGHRHVSVTGGNPLVQADAVEELLRGLRDLGHHTLVETQASIFHEGVFRALSMASLSPKLHDFRPDVLERILKVMRSRHAGGETQIKIVVQTVEEVRFVLDMYAAIDAMWRTDYGRPSYILLPEYSKGRKFIHAIHQELDMWSTMDRPVVRLVPQIHKLFLGVA